MLVERDRRRVRVSFIPILLFECVRTNDPGPVISMFKLVDTVTLTEELDQDNSRGRAKSIAHWGWIEAWPSGYIVLLEPKSAGGILGRSAPQMGLRTLSVHKQSEQMR
jgi:hypothetical protein